MAAPPAHIRLARLMPAMHPRHRVPGEHACWAEQSSMSHPSLHLVLENHTFNGKWEGQVGGSPSSSVQRRSADHAPVGSSPAAPPSAASIRMSVGVTYPVLPPSHPPSTTALHHR